MAGDSSGEVDLSIFVSCYNESLVITDTLDLVRVLMHELGYAYEVLIYDDASEDNSVAVINEYIAKNELSEIYFLERNEINRGIGYNYFNAAEKARGRYFYKLNGGNAHPVESIKKLLLLIGHADMVVPYFRGRLFNSRYNTDFRPFHRRLLCLVFAKLVRLLSGHQVKYFNGGVLHLRKNVLENRIDASGFGFQAELICRILRDPAVDYLEVRQDNVDLAGGSTAFRPRNVLSVLGSLWRIFLGRFAD